MVKMTAIRAKYFDEVMIEFKNGDLIIAELAKDGLIYVFPFETIEPILDMHYPKDDHGWYFNSSRDRYIAEIGAEGISTNPMFVTEQSIRVIA